MYKTELKRGLRDTRRREAISQNVLFQQLQIIESVAGTVQAQSGKLLELVCFCTDREAGLQANSQRNKAPVGPRQES